MERTSKKSSAFLTQTRSFPCLVMRIESGTPDSSLGASAGSAARSTSIDSIVNCKVAVQSLPPRGVRKCVYHYNIDKGYSLCLPSHHNSATVIASGQLNSTFENSRHSLPFRCRHLCLGTVEDLLKLRYSMPHAGVHIGLATFDVVVEVVTEQLNVRDCIVRYVRLGKVAGKEHKGDISNVFRIAEARHIPDFEGRVTIRIEYLGCVLDTGLTSSINKFLVAASPSVCLKSNAINSPAEIPYQIFYPSPLGRRLRISLSLGQALPECIWPLHHDNGSASGLRERLQKHPIPFAVGMPTQTGLQGRSASRGRWI